MTFQYRLVANAQTACTMLLGKNFQGRQLYKMILGFTGIVYFDRRYIAICRCPIRP